MTDDAPRLVLKPEPDGFGFLYGELVAGDGEAYRVDIMPPATEWRGDMKPSDRLPHPTDWVVHLDGEEIARVRRREDIDGAVQRRITQRP
jgi:hypothetical protein